jgi:hypothetical protein
MRRNFVREPVPPRPAQGTEPYPPLAQVLSCTRQSRDFFGAAELLTVTLPVINVRFAHGNFTTLVGVPVGGGRNQPTPSALRSLLNNIGRRCLMDRSGLC